MHTELGEDGEDGDGVGGGDEGAKREGSQHRERVAPKRTLGRGGALSALEKYSQVPTREAGRCVVGRSRRRSYERKVMGVNRVWV